MKWFRSWPAQYQNDTIQASDTSFSFWYRDNVGPARVTWNVHPQHLHPYSDWS